jgi:hypothetical protein
MTARRLENLAHTDPIPGPEHERKKRELRARFKAQHESATHTRTVTTKGEIAINDAARWQHPSEFRAQAIAEAEAARLKWGKIPGSPWYDDKVYGRKAQEARANGN